jgi:[ribosomal protein S5]-alanine N-acetyltransferase
MDNHNYSENVATERLILSALSHNDTAFIYELVNTPEWIRFIGQRNVTNHEEATNYINRILNNANARYTTVRLKDSLTPIGVITFLQRDYLPHPDIGFAFLPRFGKKGYAYEAAKAVLDSIKTTKSHKMVLATTLPDNVNSIQLLEKLGLQFDKEITVGDEKLLLYGTVND